MPWPWTGCTLLTGRPVQGILVDDVTRPAVLLKLMWLCEMTIFDHMTLWGHPTHALSIHYSPLLYRCYWQPWPSHLQLPHIPDCHCRSRSQLCRCHLVRTHLYRCLGRGHRHQQLRLWLLFRHWHQHRHLHRNRLPRQLWRMFLQYLRQYRYVGFHCM